MISVVGMKNKQENQNGDDTENHVTELYSSTELEIPKEVLVQELAGGKTYKLTYQQEIRPGTNLQTFVLFHSMLVAYLCNLGHNTLWNGNCKTIYLLKSMVGVSTWVRG